MTCCRENSEWVKIPGNKKVELGFGVYQESCSHAIMQEPCVHEEWDVALTGRARYSVAGLLFPGEAGSTVSWSRA